MSGPLVSVVTPCLDPGPRLSRCIESVRNQTYGNVEHVIMDGGSTDGTVKLLRSSSVSRWVSEPDRGQTDALNKGFALCTGELLGWVAADDTLVFVVDLVEAAPEPLAMAEGEEQELPAGLPTLETDGEGVPTGFTADADTDETVEQLVVAPAIIGDGPEVQEGQTATVHYVGQLYPDGKIFDESWSSGQPAEFPLQPGGLIQGFLDGLVGQPVGSRVVIAIPSEEGYGKAGSPPAIPPDSDLIFVVDILAAS